MIVSPGTEWVKPWYDRGLTSIIDNYGGTVGPHGATVRLDYTVPVGYNLKMHAIWYFTQRITVATSGPLFKADITINPVGSALRNLLDVRSIINVAEDIVIDRLFQDLWFAAGDAITFESTDLSTGGTITFNLGYFGSLYTV